MKKIFFILITFFFVVNCDKEESINDYDSTNLLDKNFISTNNNPLTIILSNGGGREIFKDTTWYNFNNSNQLTIKSQLIFLEKPNTEDIIPYLLQNQDTLFLGYVNIIRDYVIENENSIRFTSRQINFPEGINLPESDRNINSMRILEFNDSFLNVQFEYTTISTSKDSIYTRLLKPANH